MGGAKKPVNIFKLSLDDDPKEVINRRLCFAVFSFGIMGVARGIDEGLISGTFNTKHFQNTLHLIGLDDIAYANIKGNVSAMVQIGSVAGALLAFLVADRIGRLWAIRQLCALWILGIVIFLTNAGRLGQVYTGRFIAGVGIGETTVIAPVYIAEIAPESVRGLCTCVFAGAVYVGITLAYFATWGSFLYIDQNTANAWVVPTSIHIMFAGIIFVLSFFNYESPSYLIKQGNVAHAVENLVRVRCLPPGHEAIFREIHEVQDQLEEEKEATMGQGVFGILHETFCMPNNAYRLYLGLGVQLLSQWSGAGSITIYAADFFTLLGTKDQNEKLFATAILGVVKLVAAITCAFFLVDVIGRKRALIIGITLQAISMAYIAAFLTAVRDLGREDFVFTSSNKHASIGAIVMIYISGFGWAMGMLMLAGYLTVANNGITFFYSVYTFGTTGTNNTELAGWNSVQYLINAEIYPLRIRAFSSSLVMCFHFVNQYGNSKAVPKMLLSTSHDGLTVKGTFWLFFAITTLGGIWAWLTIPETSRLSLEATDHLFTLPWYKIGLYGRKEVEIQNRFASEWELDAMSSINQALLPNNESNDELNGVQVIANRVSANQTSHLVV